VKPMRNRSSNSPPEIGPLPLRRRSRSPIVTGELFGFDRTRELSTRSAEQITRTAQAYGQQDDITVLAVTFAPA
jgi:hypothetical protein